MINIKSIAIYFLLLSVLVQILQMINLDNLTYELYILNNNFFEFIGSNKLIASFIASFLFFVINIILVLPLYFYIKKSNSKKYFYAIAIYSLILAVISFVFSNIFGMIFIFVYFALIYLFMYIFIDKSVKKIRI
ncbi:hypothetical protein CRU92_03920 [Arcobacter sp. FW59]|nr:hypothetical protein CRU92_03920 [Arcobacter sp. FW59]